MDKVLESLRDTILRFGLNSQSLTADAAISDTTITVNSTRRFFEREQIVIRDSSKGEMHVIKKIVDSTTLEIEDPLIAAWAVATGIKVEKSFDGQYVKRVYIGDPDVIPDFPAITITADSRDEEWWTLNSTTAKWNCTISCLFEQSNLEDAYTGMLKLTNTIEKALWANRWPVLDTITSSDLTVDASQGDSVITVASTTDMQPKNHAHIEDYDHTDFVVIKRIISSTQIEIENRLTDDYSVLRSAKIIVPSRWVMWTYPPNTTYGYVHKGTLLKASQISWFAQEEVVRLNKFTGPVEL